jgi:hypothetical protein
LFTGPAGCASSLMKIKAVSTFERTISLPRAPPSSLVRICSNAVTASAPCVPRDSINFGKLRTSSPNTRSVASWLPSLK